MTDEQLREIIAGCERWGNLKEWRYLMATELLAARDRLRELEARQREILDECSERASDIRALDADRHALRAQIKKMETDFARERLHYCERIAKLTAQLGG